VIPILLMASKPKGGKEQEISCEVILQVFNSRMDKIESRFDCIESCIQNLGNRLRVVEDGVNFLSQVTKETQDREKKKQQEEARRVFEEQQRREDEQRRALDEQRRRDDEARRRVKVSCCIAKKGNFNQISFDVAQKLVQELNTQSTVFTLIPDIEDLEFPTGSTSIGKDDKKAAADFTIIIIRTSSRIDWDSELAPKMSLFPGTKIVVAARFADQADAIASSPSNKGNNCYLVPMTVTHEGISKENSEPWNFIAGLIDRFAVARKASH